MRWLLLLIGYKVSVLYDKVLEIGGYDGCRVMCMYLISVNFTLKNGQSVNFMSILHKKLLYQQDLFRSWYKFPMRRVLRNCDKF